MKDLVFKRMRFSPIKSGLRRGPQNDDDVINEILPPIQSGQNYSNDDKI